MCRRWRRWRDADREEIADESRLVGGQRRIVRRLEPLGGADSDDRLRKGDIGSEEHLPPRSLRNCDRPDFAVRYGTAEKNGFRHPRHLQVSEIFAFAVKETRVLIAA